MMRPGPWRDARRSKAVWFSAVVLLCLLVLSVLAPLIAPHDPYDMAAAHANLPPMWVGRAANPGSPEFPLGTDRFGRDVLSRLAYGTRTALLLVLAGVPLAALLGTAAGLLSASAGGRSAAAMLIFMDTIQSLPGILFLVLTVLLLRGRLPSNWESGLLTLTLGFAAISWVSLARLVRVTALQIKAQLFVEAAVSIGATPLRIVLRHLLPNLSHVILVWVINAVPAIILLEAMLGYVGVGVTAAADGGEFTVVSFGGMFFSGRSALRRNPLMLLIPSLCVLLISMSFILLADWLNSRTRKDVG